MLKLRIVVQKPLPGVELRLQRGRAELIAPTSRSSNTVTFDFELAVDTKPDGTIVLRGSEAQGPPAARFVYINSGTYAGDADSPWGTRAKVPLTGISASVVKRALASPRSVVVGTIAGTAKNGGPAAATVPLLGEGWKV